MSKTCRYLWWSDGRENTAGDLVPSAGEDVFATAWDSAPFTTIQNWVEAAGKKVRAQVETSYLEWALANFSGYLAVDELYDGPFCVLSAVDSPRQRRLLYEVLDHDPEHEDIRQFLDRLHQAIAVRGVVVRGITTDTSPLYPRPIAQVFGHVPHQICQFHILKELNKAVLSVVARVRKELAAQAPVLSRGRPREDARSQTPPPPSSGHPPTGV